MFRNAFALVFVLLLPALLSAQTTTGTSEKTILTIDSLFVNLLDYLPPINELIDTAVEHSPEVKYWHAQVKLREYEVSLAKKDWARDVYVTGQYQGGTLGANINPDGSAILLGYLVGAGLRVPLSTVVGRKDRIGAAEAWLESTISKKEEAIRNIRELIFNEYQKLLMIQRKIAILTETNESTSLIMEMAEERFRQGELTLDQLGTNTELKTKYSLIYEELRTEFFNTYTQLERLVGIPFSKFEKH
ncbi:MAG: TolC family protein [Thermaurantimonas sp.]